MQIVSEDEVLDMIRNNPGNAAAIQSTASTASATSATTAARKPSTATAAKKQMKGDSSAEEGSAEEKAPVARGPSSVRAFAVVLSSLCV